ncbi:MAG: hypothetical protein ACYCVD_04520 [Desulfitobacteriaceae bacterium]
MDSIDEGQRNRADFRIAREFNHYRLNAGGISRPGSPATASSVVGRHYL